MKRQPRIYSPRTANTFNKVCSLQRDNLDFPCYWFSVSDETVTIAEQTSGHPATAVITLSKRDFNRIIKFYETPTRHRSQK